MPDDSATLWRSITDDARWYPSPHNSQPIKLRPVSETEARVYYDLDLGLPAESFGIPFGHVCAGVFLESLSVVAAAKGYRTVETLDHSEMDFDAADRLHPLGTVRLVPLNHNNDADDLILTSAAARLSAFRSRQTSRRPYDNSLVADAVVAGAAAIAAEQGFEFRTTADARTVTSLVRINQATLFSDLQNDAVYAEIMHWLRFSKEEAAEHGDGLSAETMLMPGPVLRFAMGHRGLWSFPVIGGIIRSIYLRTMRGVRQLGWLEGPFAEPAHYVEAGRTFMRVWLYFTENGVRLHPFGTVITNPKSHAQFVSATDIDESGDRMAWMLFRFGHSAVPPDAHRRPTDAMLLTGPLTGSPSIGTDS
jgi:hypothetical protein